MKLRKEPPSWKTRFGRSIAEGLLGMGMNAGGTAIGSAIQNHYASQAAEKQRVHDEMMRAKERQSRENMARENLASMNRRHSIGQSNMYDRQQDQQQHAKTILEDQRNAAQENRQRQEMLGMLRGAPAERSRLGGDLDRYLSPQTREERESDILAFEGPEQFRGQSMELDPDRKRSYMEMGKTIDGLPEEQKFPETFLGKLRSKEEAGRNRRHRSRLKARDEHLDKKHEQKKDLQRGKQKFSGEKQTQQIGAGKPQAILKPAPKPVKPAAYMSKGWNSPTKKLAQQYHDSEGKWPTTKELKGLYDQGLRIMEGK